MKNKIKSVQKSLEEIVVELPDRFVFALIEGNSEVRQEKLAELLSILCEIDSIAALQLNTAAFQINQHLPRPDENERLRNNLIGCVEAFRKYADLVAAEEFNYDTVLMGDPRILPTIIAVRELISQNLSHQVQSAWFKERELDESLRLASENKLKVFPPTLEAVEELFDNVLKWTLRGCLVKFARQQALGLERIVEEHLAAGATRAHTMTAIQDLQLQTKGGLYQSLLIGAFNACKGVFENDDAFEDHD